MPLNLPCSVNSVIDSSSDRDEQMRIRRNRESATRQESEASFSQPGAFAPVAPVAVDYNAVLLLVVVAVVCSKSSLWG